MWDLYSKNIKLKNRSYLSQAGTVQISYVLTIYFISQEQNNGGFVHNSLSEKKCTVGKHKDSPAYHKPGSHKGKSPYALIPNGNNMMKPYHTLSGRHGMHFSPVSSHMKKDRKDVFSPVSVFCSPVHVPHGMFIWHLWITSIGPSQAWKGKWNTAVTSTETYRHIKSTV